MVMCINKAANQRRVRRQQLLAGFFQCRQQLLAGLPGTWIRGERVRGGE